MENIRSEWKVERQRLKEYKKQNKKSQEMNSKRKKQLGRRRDVKQIWEGIRKGRNGTRYCMRAATQEGKKDRRGGSE